jgi:histidine decarboxylase
LNEIDIKALSNPNALTVVFPKPPAHICTKWQLATENDIAHVICMPGLTKEKLGEFVDDLKEAYL